MYMSQCDRDANKDFILKIRAEVESRIPQNGMETEQKANLLKKISQGLAEIEEIEKLLPRI